MSFYSIASNFVSRRLSSTYAVISNMATVSPDNEIIDAAAKRVAAHVAALVVFGDRYGV